MTNTNGIEERKSCFGFWVSSFGETLSIFLLVPFYGFASEFGDVWSDWTLLFLVVYSLKVGHERGVFSYATSFIIL